jgi:hypothetical protein
MTAVAAWMAKSSSITVAFGSVPDGIEVSRRIAPNGSVFVLVNLSADAKIVPLPRQMQSLLGSARNETSGAAIWRCCRDGPKEVAL